MPSHRLFVSLLGFLIGLSPLAIDMYLPSMPAIVKGLSTSPEAVQMTLSVYLAFFALPQLFFGPLSDALGRRFTIFCGLAFYTAGGLLAGAAPNIATLLVARAIQATGSAAMVVTVPALVKDRFNGSDYTSTMGFIMVIMAIAPLIAPIAGGFILKVGGWRTIFFTLVATGIICTVMFHQLIPETLPRDRRNRLRLKPFMNNYRRLLLDRHCLGLTLCASFMFAGLMTFITGSSFVYIEYYGVEPQYYGFLLGINVIAMMGLTSLNNRLVYTFTNERLLRLSVIAVACAALALLALSFPRKPPLVLVILCCALYIGNMGMLTANVMSILMRRFARISGATAAFTGALRFGVASLGGMAVGLWHTGTATPMAAVMAICGFLAALTYIVAGREPEDESGSDQENGPSSARLSSST